MTVKWSHIYLVWSSKRLINPWSVENSRRTCNWLFYESQARHKQNALFLDYNFSARLFVSVTTLQSRPNIILINQCEDHIPNLTCVSYKKILPSIYSVQCNKLQKFCFSNINNLSRNILNFVYVVWTQNIFHTLIFFFVSISEKNVTFFMPLTTTKDKGITRTMDPSLSYIEVGGMKFFKW